VERKEVDAESVRASPTGTRDGKSLNEFDAEAKTTKKNTKKINIELLYDLTNL
jgi:hypothetical protein